jgi:hypothetical protein
LSENRRRTELDRALRSRILRPYEKTFFVLRLRESARTRASPSIVQTLTVILRQRRFCATLGSPPPLLLSSSPLSTPPRSLHVRSPSCSPSQVFRLGNCERRGTPHATLSRLVIAWCASTDRGHDSLAALAIAARNLPVIIETRLTAAACLRPPKELQRWLDPASWTHPAAGTIWIQPSPCRRTMTSSSSSTWGSITSATACSSTSPTSTASRVKVDN